MDASSANKEKAPVIKSTAQRNAKTRIVSIQGVADTMILSNLIGVFTLSTFFLDNLNFVLLRTAITLA